MQQLSRSSERVGLQGKAFGGDLMACGDEVAIAEGREYLNPDGPKFAIRLPAREMVMTRFYGDPKVL